MKQSEKNLMVIENFIDYFTSNEEEREQMKRCAYGYIDEDWSDGKEADEPDPVPPKPTYVLFGEEAVSLFENEGMKGFIKEYKKNNEYLSFSVQAISSNATPVEILSIADGWNSYLILTKDEYQKLSEL